MIFRPVMKSHLLLKPLQKPTQELFIILQPNRIILFYGDAQVSGEYTPVGYFDNTDEFRSAVENNPVLEGWGNKIVRISDGN